MIPWNVHQKLRAALRRMDYHVLREQFTRQRRTPAEKKANTTARRCLARAYADLQAAMRKT